MSIQPTHQQHRRHRLLLTRAFRKPYIQRNFLPLILLRSRRVRNLHILNRTLEQARRFQIRLFLCLVCGDFDVAVDVGKSSNTVDSAGAEVDVDGGLLVSLFSFRVALRDEVFGGGEEFFGVFDAVAVVDALFDAGLEDGCEVFVFAVVEGVEGAFAREFPFLVPGRLFLVGHILARCSFVSGLTRDSPWTPDEDTPGRTCLPRSTCYRCVGPSC